MNTLQINGYKLSFNRFAGNGIPVIFLHGYLETKEAFTSFITRYLKGVEVIAVDLPGHGDSEALGLQQTMYQMAGQILSMLNCLNISKYLIYGHSMGGYIAQTLTRIAPERVMILGLLHSNVYADSDEKKQNRLREIEMIQQGKLPLIASNFMPIMIADSNIKKCSNEINSLTDNASKMQPSGVISCLYAMIGREDNSALLNGSVPVHLIGSTFDRFLPDEIYTKMLQGSAVKYSNIIDNCGHASFIEQPEQLGKILSVIIKNVNQ